MESKVVGIESEMISVKPNIVVEKHDWIQVYIVSSTGQWIIDKQWNAERTVDAMEQAVRHAEYLARHGDPVYIVRTVLPAMGIKKESEDDREEKTTDTNASDTAQDKTPAKKAAPVSKSSGTSKTDSAD